jgi:hypothetical protein
MTRPTKSLQDPHAWLVPTGKRQDTITLALYYSFF